MSPVVYCAQLAQHPRVMWHKTGQHLQPPDGCGAVARHVCSQRQAMHHLQAATQDYSQRIIQVPRLRHFTQWRPTSSYSSQAWPGRHDVWPCLIDIHGTVEGLSLPTSGWSDSRLCSFLSGCRAASGSPSLRLTTLHNTTMF
jgi:hypothetical protein